MGSTVKVGLGAEDWENELVLAVQDAANACEGDLGVIASTEDRSLQLC